MNGSGGGGGGNNSGRAPKYQHVPSFDFGGYFDPPPASASNISGSILGWTWLGNWADNTLSSTDPIRIWMNDWIARFEEASNAELTGDTGGPVPIDTVESLTEQFKLDLWKQPWWKKFDASWQAVQRLRFGTDVPAGEYESLVESTIERIGDLGRSLGFVDPRTGELTLDLNSDEIRSLAENVILNGSDVINELPSLNSDMADGIIEDYLLSERGFDAEEGLLNVGPGSLQDIYDQFERVAANNYVSIAPEELWDLVVRVKREDMSFQSAYDVISRKVGEQYSFLDDTSILNRINSFAFDSDSNEFGGSSLKSYLSPIRSSLASVWELGAGEVQLDSIFGADLGGLVVGEGADERFMNSREAARWARTQPQFKETQGYAYGMSNIAQSMLQMFGAR